MKNLKNILIVILLYLSFMSLVSCKKAIETKPMQSIDIETALSTTDNIKAAITAVYASFKGANLYGRDLLLLPDALADNGRATGKSGRLMDESTNTRGAHFSHWIRLYNAINDINLIIDAIPNLTPAPSEAQINAWMGELKFLRALAYFNLNVCYAYIPGAEIASQNFGGVPILTKGVKNLVDAKAVMPSRAPISEVYQLIYKDLTEAEAKLATLSVRNVNKANKQAAQLLFARAALYIKDYQKAYEKANEVILAVGSKLRDFSNYISAWREKVHPESIFEIAFTINSENIGVNTSLQSSLTTLVTPGIRSVTGGFGDLVPTPSLLLDLGVTVSRNGSGAANITNYSDDIRNRLYEVGTAGRGNPWVECTKFMGKSGFLNLDNVPVFRVSEAFLIKAEVLASNGSVLKDEVAAKIILTDFKRKRYSNYVGTQLDADLALTGATLLEEILRQRRIEFAFEGHRFFDLKRLGRGFTKFNRTIFNFDNPFLLPAIPTREIDGNPALKQNFGY